MCKSKYTCNANPLKLSFGRFLWSVETKKQPNDNLKRFACIFALVSVLV